MEPRPVCYHPLSPSPSPSPSELALVEQKRRELKGYVAAYQVMSLYGRASRGADPRVLHVVDAATTATKITRTHVSNRGANKWVVVALLFACLDFWFFGFFVGFFAVSTVAFGASHFSSPRVGW